jgi:hypothetical protein
MRFFILAPEALVFSMTQRRNEAGVTSNPISEPVPAGGSGTRNPLAERKVKKAKTP